ncbi:MAG: ribulose bisphosphate carboxylase small subunit [Ferrimicrobium sp.]|uniref:ribulose bisphosphate carboxylase small subunit n=1 Tax=Ferrimicrobium sp. TaxID=2926050 RepID=UPI0026391FB2|nr:ribulose bisphosphate carboxylase small subunit [Ferrimicrobium sp.]
MHLTQGQFSFLPPLTDEQISAQIRWALDHDWALGIEFTDDPHPRNTYWDMWGMPMFDLRDPAAILYEINECRRAYPNRYIRVTAFDSTRGWEAPRMSYLVNRPEEEPGFGLVRQEGEGRHITYTTHSYATEQPPGERY